MPQYIYKHPTEEKYVEVVQHMLDKHEFFDTDGLEWKRVFTVPQAIVSAGSEVDPFDTRKHVEKTGNMKGSMGDLFDFAKEMSERRAHKLGHEDPVKRKFLDDYAKKTGTKHLDDLPKKIETKDAVIDLTKPMELPKGGVYDMPVVTETTSSYSKKNKKNKKKKYGCYQFPIATLDQPLFPPPTHPVQT